MQAVDTVIGQRMESDIALVGQIAHYIIHSGGKRLRPRLLLLIAGALDCTDARRFELAAVIEFIHTATLLHDDVVDESALRRGNSTANQVFGNAASVLVGDFLYSRAFQMMVSCRNMQIMQVLADATNIIAEGEVQQLMNTHDATLDQAAYLRVIRSKTARLFEASACVAAILAGAPPERAQRCGEYGEALGTAFQIIDDVLDYDGDPSVMGKNLGDDLREGKATLPLIFAMQRASHEDAALIRDAIERGASDQMQAIAAIVHGTSALEASRTVAAAEARRAAEAAASLPHNPYSATLIKLADSLLQRRA